MCTRFLVGSIKDYTTSLPVSFSPTDWKSNHVFSRDERQARCRERKRDQECIHSYNHDVIGSLTGSSTGEGK